MKALEGDLLHLSSAYLEEFIDAFSTGLGRCEEAYSLQDRLRNGLNFRVTVEKVALYVDPLIPHRLLFEADHRGRVYTAQPVERLISFLRDSPFTCHFHH